MGIAGAHLSILVLTARLSDLQGQLMSISDKRQVLSYEQSGLMANSEWYKDPKVKLLQLKDNDFDIEQKKIQTSIQATEKNLEAQEKLRDNNIKREFGYKLSI